MEEQHLIKKILDIKKEFGEKLVILTHHYQRRAIFALGDYGGDSFELSRKASMDEAAQFIVFCGVHFMAESAEILSRPHQIVQMPDLNAGCPMADMADISDVEKAWGEVIAISGENSVTPVVYMNAAATIKDFCGRNGGIVCTSSNTPAAFEWSFKRRGKIFFFPDQHLGRNTGNKMGVKPDQMILWNSNEPLGGNTAESIKNAQIILWNGFCHVHTDFKVDDIRQMKEKYPDSKIVVHPECPQEVVELSDAAGSTSFIVKYVEEASPGSIIIIGTEFNLVDRLAAEYKDKKILPLYESTCPNMYKIDLKKLLWSLENIGKVNVIKVPETIKKGAKVALDRMLAL